MVAALVAISHRQDARCFGAVQAFPTSPAPRRIFRLEALFLYLILKTAIFLCYNRKVNMRYSPLSAEYTAGREVATVEI